jgi:energy-converting hydrogenase A subunit M
VYWTDVAVKGGLDREVLCVNLDARELDDFLRVDLLVSEAGGLEVEDEEVIEVLSRHFDRRFCCGEILSNV